VNSGYSSSGQVKIKTRSDQVKSCQFGTKPGQVWCVQVKLGQCEAKAMARTGPVMSGQDQVNVKVRSGDGRIVQCQVNVSSKSNHVKSQMRSGHIKFKF